tara:strand:+ start:786 stop:1097 length:312 start_codon:yes stop_codon:yes gene_type:complete
VYFVYSLIEKAINIKSPSKLEFKIIDIIFGGLYGLFLFSILFYLSYSLVFKNHIIGNNFIYHYNISFYENFLKKEGVNLNTPKKNNKNMPTKDNKKNAQEKLY